MPSVEQFVSVLTHPPKDEIMTQNSEMISERKTGAISLPNRYTVVYAIFWIIITAVLSIMLYSGFRGRSQVREIIVILGVISTSAIIWYLSQTGPSASELPDLHPLLFSKWKFRGVLSLLTLTLLIGPILLAVILTVPLYPIGGTHLLDKAAPYLQPWIILEISLALIAIRIIFKWRSQIKANLVLLGLAAGLIAGAAQLVQITNSGDPFDVFWGILQTIVVPPLFIGGGLLLAHTGIGRNRLMEGNYNAALLSFLSGCLLYLPLALVNTLGGAHAGYTWMNALWKPLSFSWLPAIAEETWARMFLITLCYALLRPVTNERPHRAVIAAVLLSATAHGLVHGPSLSNLFETGLMYLLPMAVLFVKRDWEHAVGAHYVVNLFPFLAVFLKL
jgi:hypothetical protein